MKDRTKRIPLKERLRRSGSARPRDGAGRCSLRNMMDSPLLAYLGSKEEEDRLYQLLPMPPKEGGHLSYRDVASQVCRMWNCPGGRKPAVRILDILAKPAEEYAVKGGSANG